MVSYNKLTDETPVIPLIRNFELLLTGLNSWVRLTHTTDVGLSPIDYHKTLVTRHIPGMTGVSSVNLL
jgi:hypothetical protein